MPESAEQLLPESEWTRFDLTLENEDTLELTTEALPLSKETREQASDFFFVSSPFLLFSPLAGSSYVSFARRASSSLIFLVMT